MIEMIEKYLPIIVVAGILLIIIFHLINLRYNFFLAKFFSNKKYRITSNFIYDASIKKEGFKLTIFNNNVNDSRVIAFGFIYKNHAIDYLKTYRKDNDLNLEKNTIITSRDCISVEIVADELKMIITDINRGKMKLGKLRAFVSDSMGITHKTKVKQVKKQLKQMLRTDSIEEKLQANKHAEQAQIEAEEKKTREKLAKKQLREDFFAKMRIKLKTLFRK
ncbi:MAG: hypothetical protein WCY80_06215 [Candidatus Izemoplasmatales bacterium]